jgi:hypothetical protein
MRIPARISTLLFVALTMSAVFVPAAQAEQSYRSSASPTALSGTEVATSRFHFPGAGTWECTGFNLTGTKVGTANSTLELHPSLSGCVAFGFAATHSITTGCNFHFGTPAKNSAGLEIVCTGTNKIKITPTFFGASVCSLEIGSQTPSGGVDLTNNVGKGDFLITWTLTGISHSAGCGASAGADGEYTGSVTEVGSNDIWVE